MENKKAPEASEPPGLFIVELMWGGRNPGNADYSVISLIISSRLV